MKQWFRKAALCFALALSVLTLAACGNSSKDTVEPIEPSVKSALEEQAKQYIQNAVFSATVWGGQYERYYGSEGVVYVNISTSSIRTAYGKAEFDDTLKNLVKELEQNGLLGERGIQAG